jgi:hypothetical protein
MATMFYSKYDEIKRGNLVMPLFGRAETSGKARNEGLCLFQHHARRVLRGSGQWAFFIKTRKNAASVTMTVMAIAVILRADLVFPFVCTRWNVTKGPKLRDDEHPP